MDEYILSLALMGAVGLLVAWLPTLLKPYGVSYAIVFLALGFVLYSLTDALPVPSPLREGTIAVRLSELVVIIALMGTGLKIDSAFGLRRWAVPVRLIFITMILSIASLAFLGHWWAGLPWAGAVLLAAALAPTDPVLAADVQVDAPNKGREDPTRFSLTAEAGLNDGMAFPFVWMAVAIALASQNDTSWLGEWAWYDLAYRTAAGLGIGYVLGRAIAYLFFYLPEHSKWQDVREGLVAIAATLLVYGVTELAHGYGFIAVFVAAVTIRNYELTHRYHTTLHSFSDQVERVLLSIVLVLFGGALATGILDALTMELALIGLVFLFVIRPLAGIVGLIGTRLNWQHKLAISFFGIRGVGSFFYLSFGLSQAMFSQADDLWAAVSFVVMVSVVLHGLSASRVIRKVRMKK